MKEKARIIYKKGKDTISEQSFHRYLFIGITTVLIDYFLLIILRQIFSSSLVYAVSIAYWTSITYNYLLNRYWSFAGSNEMIPKQLLLYGSLLLFNYSVTLGIVWGLTHLGISEYISKIFALGITVTWTYFAYKKIVFNTPGEKYPK